jgi:UDP-N-acetylglucosamine transferase subunit ALG13
MEEVYTKIFVTVGSRPYQFNRLFVKLDELIEKGIAKGTVFAQIGTSTYKPKHFEYKEFVSPKEFIARIKEADIVITHGASGSIMKALYEKKKVIAVTRLEKYGEHINDHQIQNNEAFGLNKYVLPVFEMDKLDDAFLALYNDTADLKPYINKDPLSIIKMVDNFIIKTWKK